MKMTIDKKNSNLPLLEQEAKEFSERYADNDLINAFADAIPEFDHLWGSRVISADVKAFSAEGSNYPEEVAFQVELVLRGIYSFWTVSYYCDKNLTVDTHDMMFHRGKLYTVNHYKLVDEDANK